MINADLIGEDTRRAVQARRARETAADAAGRSA
jgi:hypothetical protein